MKKELIFSLLAVLIVVLLFFELADPCCRMANHYRKKSSEYYSKANHLSLKNGILRDRIEAIILTLPPDKVKELLNKDLITAEEAERYIQKKEKQKKLGGITNE